MINRWLGWLSVYTGYQLGRVVGQVGDGTSGVLQVLDTVGQYGIAGIFIWLYFVERKERKEAQADLRVMGEKFGSALSDSVQALKEVERGMSLTVERAGASDRRNDVDLTLRRLELAADEIIAETRRRDRERER